MDKIVIMKISYRTHPALKFLDQGSIDEFKVFEDQDISDFDERLVNIFRKYNNAFNEVKYMTKPFCEAAIKASGKLFKEGCYDELFDTGNIQGTLIIGKSVVFYKITQEDIVIIAFEEEWLHTFVFFNKHGGEKYLWTNDLKDLSGPVEERCLRVLMRTMDFIVFAKYAPLEVEELPAGQKILGIKCNYEKCVSEIKTPIKIINSLWFTTLVKSDAFKVRGHFRLQPKKKNGEWTKELIWINEFQKTGYTAPARKLKEEA